MKTALVLALATAALATIGALAATSRAPTAVAAANVVDCEREATVGYFGPTTGPAASIGEELRRFSILYAQQWNKRGKRPRMRIVEGDTTFDPAQASTIARQFVFNRDVLGVIGPGVSHEVLAAKPIFKRVGMAYIAASATRTSLTDGTNPTFFRIAPPDAAQARSAARFMLERLEVKIVVVADDGSDYGRPLAQAVAELLEQGGAKVTRTSVARNQSDYSALIRSLPDDVDLVYLAWQLPAKMQLFGVQMKEQGKDRVGIFVSDAGFSEQFTIVGAHFSTFGPDVRTFPQASSVLNAYFKKYGKKALLTIFGPLGYVSGQVMVDAVGRACGDGSATRAEVLQQVRRTNLKTSIIGEPIRFNARGDLIGARFFTFVITKKGPVTIG